ncbi:cucumisin-like [Abrus precatorius]|uniref:Cucumisin-like n=1 Tax=Abrus precatorius TaxID=3816 RepID=A0A8B8M993_ABRPR|nr:cucumisin-like [Abrus precatorius]
MQTYIVYMGDHPKGVKSTELLHNSMVQHVLGSKFAPDALLHSYKKSFNGFVVKLTEEEAGRMAELDGVVSVFPNKKNKLQTTRSWDFIGFPQNVKRTTIESDIIIGVIDYGIWPESESFNDKGFGPPPKKWKGTCHNFTCNNKIIGAKYFRMDGAYGKDDMISPRDSFGHGTHCASIAAGNSVSSASFFGLASGTARGGVPSARIAVYKPCWVSSGCDDVDVLHAFDEAIADGVDIISISLGPVQVVYPFYFNDVFAIGAFHAMKKGILTSHSAGNNGPQTYTISNNAPWLLSVAASTTDRKFLTTVRLGDGTLYEGISVNSFDLKNESYPLIYAGDAANITGGYNRSTSRLCLENSLDENLVKGKIVLCDGFQVPSSVGLVSGAAGIIFSSVTPKDVAFTFALPAILLSRKDGTLVHSYINSTSNPSAIIFRSDEGKDSLAPYVASFSSRGPNPITPEVLKPDIAAPGVDILAAWSRVGSVSGVKGDKRIANYNIESGTSMACPHASAAAAYIKSFHPDWSPAAIKSALMTTATPMSVALNPEAEFAYGAGQLNPIKGVNPGLVYDINEIDYVKFLCGQGYDTKKLRSITSDNSTCTQANNGTVWDLNLPSFALSTNTSIFFSAVFHRTVTNVGLATSRYKARVTTPPSLLSIKVEPEVLSFSSVGQKMSFSLTIEGIINVDVVSSSLIWDDGTAQVRSPVVVYVGQN